MANIKISELNPLTTVADTTVFPTVSAGNNYKLTGTVLKTYVRNSFSLATPATANLGGALNYVPSTGVFTFTPADKTNLVNNGKTLQLGTDGALTAPGRINLGTTDNIGYESFTNSNLIPYLGSKRKLSGLLKQEYANSNFTNLISTKIVDGVFSINEPSNTTTKSVRYTGYIKNPGLASQDFSFTIENPTAGDDDVTISITTEGWYVDSLGAITPGSRINTTVWGDIPGGQVQGPVTQSWDDLSADAQVEMVKVTIELKNVPALGQFNISWSSESGSSSNNFSGLAFTNLTNLVESIASDADIRVLSGSNTWKFGTDGSLTLPSAGKIVNNNKEWLFNDTDGTLSSKMFLANAGSYGTTGYSFTGDGGLDTGMFSAGDGQIQFYSNTVKVAEIASGNLTISGHPTIEGVTSTGATGTGKLVFDNAPTFSGAVTVSNGDQSTSSTTGALIIAGGVGITRNLFVGGAVSIAGKALVGTDANVMDWLNAKVIISQADTGHTHTYNMGLVGEAVAHATDTNIWGIGVYGRGNSNGAVRGGGILGDGGVTNTADTAAAVGVCGYADDTHAGGINVGLFGSASNSATGNYALYMNSGDIYGAGSQTWYLNGALSFNGTSVVTVPTLKVKDVRDTVYAATFASTFTPDAANGAIQNVTLTASITINAFANPVSGQTVTLILTQGGSGSYTLTSSMKFAGGLKTLSTTVGSVDLLTITYTGSVYYASLVTGFV
jgi:autotransporter-associated beta strand protein